MSGNEGDQWKVRLRCESQVRDLLATGRETLTLPYQKKEKRTITKTKEKSVGRKIQDMKEINFSFLR